MRLFSEKIPENHKKSIFECTKFGVQWVQIVTKLVLPYRYFDNTQKVCKGSKMRFLGAPK